jgi:signal transduction histidine kinase
MLREGAALVIVASAGRVSNAQGVRVPIDRSTSGRVLELGLAERISDVTKHLRISAAELGVPDAHTALLVPMTHRDETIGVLAAFDRGPEHASFSEEDEQLLRTFAATAANAVAMARSVEADRLRSTLGAADAERRRWARELHDDTLQGLGALRLVLASALQRADPAVNERAMRDAITEIESQIKNLRTLITDLRPAALDDLGLQAAMRALIERHRHDGLTVVGDLDLPDPRVGDGSLGADLETTVYRIAQEALTNIVKHAQCSRARIVVSATDDDVILEVQDNGDGFALDSKTTGFGLPGMRERVTLAGGTLQIESDADGTRLRAWLPRPTGAAAADRSKRTG